MRVALSWPAKWWACSLAAWFAGDAAALTADLLISLEKAQESYDKQCDKVNALREAARERFESFEPARLRGTAWAAYNAVTEVAGWREGRGADQSALFGGRAAEKSRAYEAAMSLIVK